MKSLAFTGHRPAQLGGYDANNPIEMQVKLKLKELVHQSYLSGYREFITGMALGVDQWAAQAVLGLKAEYPDVRMVAALPFVGQASIWRQDSKQIWLNLLSECDEIFVVDCDDNFDFEKIRSLMHEKNNHSKYEIVKKLYKRNEWMVDRADLVLAIYKNTPGGTEKCVQYAKSKNKKIIIYNPDNETITKL